MDWNAVNEHISSVTGSRFNGSPAGGVSGGCINRALRLVDAATDKRFFVKLNNPGKAEMFATEAAGMRAVCDTQTIRAARPICHGIADGHAYHVLEWVDMNGQGDWAEMGRQLAALHLVDVGSRFGFQRDNYIGSMPQKNDWTSDWGLFFAEHRLGFQLQAARARGGRFPKSDAVLEACGVLLSDHKVRPALVHGDLWSGNVSFTSAGEPIVFDGAPYYGDMEVDLAMSTLFGGFPPEFYAAHAALLPLTMGWETRRTLYNLYHILNHFNLFGGHYATQANEMIDRVLMTLD